MPNTAVLKASPPTLLFDDSVKESFSLHNAGTIDVHVASMQVAGPNHTRFHVKGATIFTLHKGASRAVEVDLGPGNVHLAAHATLTVHSNAADVHVALTKPANPVEHGPGPHDSGENPSTGDSPEDPSGTGWGAGGGCFAAGTSVLMADGTARPIESIGLGDAILAITERDHADEAAPLPREAHIERVLRHTGGHALVDVDGIAATPVHRWAVRDGGDAARFLRTEQFGADTALRVFDGRTTGWRAAPQPAAAGTAETVYNFTTSARTYLVGATPDGPWYVVHNDKDAKTEEEPGNPNP